MSFSSSQEKSLGSPRAEVTPGGDDNLGVPEFYIDGKVNFVGEQGGNGAQATIQDVSGAPVERQNPLGYSVGW
ncbi:hypothetical protein I203_105416 [Kwoniella mangroviensis CBS 8507]|nr:uncharacterized protein I203_01232 [Kwoniella mangroviensis CBS 8507]OCF69375.1 hypothetical protein I203_01232 [Kwoniella mangroviensis CBS 8507]